ncbi:MAG: hypothetical protein ACJAUD_000876, partial [Crocinitomicaceae bacterium]
PFVESLTDPLIVKFCAKSDELESAIKSIRQYFITEYLFYSTIISHKKIICGHIVMSGKDT